MVISTWIAVSVKAEMSVNLVISRDMMCTLYMDYCVYQTCRSNIHNQYKLGITPDHHIPIVQISN